MILVADVQHHGIQREDPMDHAWQFADQAGRFFVEHHLLAQGVEPLHVFTPLLGLGRLAARALGQPSRDHATGQKRDHRHPLLNSGNANRVQRKQEKIIECHGAQNGDIEREPYSSLRRRPHHKDQKDHPGGGRVGAGPHQQNRKAHRSQRGHRPVKHPPRIGERVHLPHHPESYPPGPMM